MIDLRSCIAVQPSGEKAKKFLFDIITNSSPPHRFAAESQRERDQWITALNEFLFTKKAVSVLFDLVAYMLSLNPRTVHIIIHNIYDAVILNIVLLCGYRTNSNDSFAGTSE